MARRDDFVGECWPVVRPFLLEYGYKDEIELVEECTLRSKALLRARALDDKVDNEVTNA